MPPAGLLVYDADCGFCTRFARWTGRGVPWQEIDLASVGATSEELQTAAGWLEKGRITAWGAAAIANALIARGRGAAPIGHLIRTPVIRLLAAHIYRVVAANRHLLPGTSHACSISRSRGLGLRIGCFAAVTLVWVLGVVADQNWGQSYPALDQPSFWRVPGGESGQFIGQRVDIGLVDEDGTETVVDEHEFLPGPPSATDGVAQWLLSATPEEAERFVSDLKVRSPASSARALHIQLQQVTYDLSSGDLESTELTRERTIPIRGPGK